MVGKTVSHYRILEKLGGGGMGVVYRAKDTRLGRHVALKFLPEQPGQKPEVLARFAREARAASALNHPHVCTIHDIGEHEGQPFIVMELMEGRTLKRRLLEKSLEVAEILELATQIASALDAAHSQGIMHRDIKPANIFITSLSQAKILDFGLAKRFSLPRPEDEQSSTELTKLGTPLGTVQYMSPEQALGKELDHRADLFSLGVVLYEMTTGRRPFQSETVTALIDAIVHTEPEPVIRYNPKVPLELARVIEKLLAKDPHDRYQTAKGLLADLRRLKRTLESQSVAGAIQGPAPGGLSVPARWRVWTLPAIAATICLGTLALWFYFQRAPSGPAQEAGVVLAEQIIPVTTLIGRELQPAISPDGTRVAFVWQGENGDNWDIYVKLMDAAPPLRLTMDASDDHGPVWSPDGRYITFFRHHEQNAGVFIVPSLGGPERKLLDAREVVGHHLSWSPDGKILAVADRDPPEGPQRIFLFSPESGEKRPLTSPPAQSSGDVTPAFSPDGEAVAFIRFNRLEPTAIASRIYIVSRDGGEERQLTSTLRLGKADGLAWTADGREILLSTEGSLWRIPASGGQPRRLQLPGGILGFPSISSLGNRLVYVERKQADWDIWRNVGPRVVRQEDSPVRLIASTRTEYSPQFSPDGTKIAFSSDQSGSLEIWVCDGDGRNPVQLTNFGTDSGSPRWSWDGRYIAFDSRKEGQRDLYIVSSEGGTPRRLTAQDSDEVRPSWSREGGWIYFGSNRSGDWQVWKMPAQGGDAVPVTKHGGREAFESRDGKFVYYAKQWGEPGIWRVPAAGGEEVRILEIGDQGHWVLLEKGICLLTDANSRPALFFFDFASRKVVEVVRLGKHDNTSFLSVSQDGQWSLYAVSNERLDSDIMLLENFH